MPFEPYRPLPYTAACVGRLNPFISGVYGLFKKDRWIYIGKGNLRLKLMGHLNGDDPSITIQAPTFFIAEITRDPDGRERELIEELRPLLGRAEVPGVPAYCRGHDGRAGLRPAFVSPVPGPTPESNNSQ